MSEQITLYTSKSSPYAHRVELALAEVGASYQSHEISLQHKPRWYAHRINPANEVPAMTYGGPLVPPTRPSADSTKITQSLIINEFTADLYPDSTFTPKNAVSRAKARFFIETVEKKFVPHCRAFIWRGGSTDALTNSLEYLQTILPENAKFAVCNDFTIADAAIAPFIAQLVVSLDNNLGGYIDGEAEKVLATLRGPKCSKVWRYWQAIREWPSFRATFDEDYTRAVFLTTCPQIRARTQAARDRMVTRLHRREIRRPHVFEVTDHDSSLCT
ncbi:hypothetical protein BD410DRAFT_785991 [Rickenella mellea]|uniref:GST N-terminal domain-containing protein n=1 Tax=Rickenella mellea TaxID=50990 RepID=A0A4Y7QAN0_9AGAM|nr:hypothetical protein BD410DRAFT_785991 [Rickenella mellea]